MDEGRGQGIGAAEDNLAPPSWPVPFRLLDVQKQGKVGISSGGIDPSSAVIVAVEVGIVEV